MEQETRRFKINFKGDRVLPILVSILVIFSILLIYSTEGNAVLNHFIGLAACFGGMFLFYHIDYRKITKYSFFLFLVAIFLLLLTLISKAVTRGISIAGHSFQTFYLIGLFVIIFFSNYFGRRYNMGIERLDTSERRIAMMYLLGFVVCIAALNMSTAIILFATGLVMFYIGNVEFSFLAKIIGMIIMLVLVLVIIVVNSSDDKSSKIGRMGTFVNRFEYYITKDNTDGYGDQMILSRAAIARSGLKPTGPGKGIIKYRLPERVTDYAFASLYEETGIVVGIIILFLYMSIFMRSWIIARNTQDQVGKMLAFGIGFWLTCQALVHIGVNCELLPATGQTLPFVSSGGMSLMVSGCAIGILLNISKISVLESGKEDLYKKFFGRD